MRTVGGYELVAALGSGSHGRYFRATPPDHLGIDDRWVALKVLSRRATDDAFGRFANELEILATVENPNLARLRDAGHEAGTLYYATDLYTGGSLAAPRICLDARRRVRALADAVHAAHALHSAGISHRDVKPANIVLTRAGRGRLTDLGLAQSLSATSTVTGFGPIGAIEFMDPAIVRGARATPATDIWAFGATLHKVLTGRSVLPVAPGSGLRSAFEHLLNGRPDIDTHLPRALRRILGRCLAPAHEDRYRSAADLAHDLETQIR